MTDEMDNFPRRSEITRSFLLICSRCYTERSCNCLISMQAMSGPDCDVCQQQHSANSSDDDNLPGWNTRPTGRQAHWIAPSKNSNVVQYAVILLTTKTFDLLLFPQLAAQSFFLRTTISPINQWKLSSRMANITLFLVPYVTNSL